LTQSTSLAAATATEVVSDDSPNTSSSPVLFLEIRRGQTCFPYRPILQSRFLIGADGACDLRLGGDDMPPLHSIIHADGRDVHLETIVASPVLRVNGTVAESVRIADGDLIEIGRFQFIAREVSAAGSQAGSQTQSESVPCDQDSDLDAEVFDQQSLEGLTAAELVEMIEQEEALVEKLEAGQRLGADALMHAVRERAGSPSDAASDAPETNVVRPPGREPGQRASQGADAARNRRAGSISPLIAAAGQLELELLQDLERALLQLNVISQELEQRSQRLSRREANYADAAETLLDAQQQLAAHLGSLLEQLPEKQAAPTRAIA